MVAPHYTRLKNNTPSGRGGDYNGQRSMKNAVKDLTKNSRMF